MWETDFHRLRTALPIHQKPVPQTSFCFFWGHSIKLNRNPHFITTATCRTLRGNRCPRTASVLTTLWLHFFRGFLLLWRKPFLLLPHDLTLKIIRKNLTKPKPQEQQQKTSVFCICIIFMLQTGFIVFGTITRLLLNMLNVKRKQTLGKCGKPITENVSARAGKHREGQRSLCTPPPSPTAENTQAVRGLEEKYDCCIVVFTFIFTGKRQKNDTSQLNLLVM